MSTLNARKQREPIQENIEVKMGRQHHEIIKRVANGTDDQAREIVEVERSQV